METVVIWVIVIIIVLAIGALVGGDGKDPMPYAGRSLDRDDDDEN